MTDSTQPPPGEPHAEALAEQLADVRVMDGPLRGSVWTYEADHGGYLPVDPELRMATKQPMTSIAALIDHAQCQVVRPIEEE